MALEFIGEIGVYFPDRDAIRFTGICAGEPIDCFIQRSALMALGSRPTDGPQELVDAFQKNRDLIERAAMTKFRRAVSFMPVIDIGVGDIRRGAAQLVPGTDLSMPARSANS